MGRGGKKGGFPSRNFLVLLAPIDPQGKKAKPARPGGGAWGSCLSSPRPRDAARVPSCRPPLYTSAPPRTCRCGGIGRRSRLKICHGQPCVGSSPTSGTSQISSLIDIRRIAVRPKLHWSCTLPRLLHLHAWVTRSISCRAARHSSPARYAFAVPLLTRQPMNAIREAERAGFDLSLVEESLRCSPEQRALQHQEALNLALALEQAGKQLRDRPQPPAAAPLRR
jgi:hypothetical protein